MLQFQQFSGDFRPNLIKCVTKFKKNTFMQLSRHLIKQRDLQIKKICLNRITIWRKNCINVFFKLVTPPEV